MSTLQHVMTVVGARPQFVKAAVVDRVLRPRIRDGLVRHTLVHTGQHHDAMMSDVFFEELRLPRPDVHLGIRGGSHGAMTGRMLEAIEAAILEDRPDHLLVYGDTNSTLAGAVAAAKLGVPVAHVEAGLRSFNRAMPEEINRVLTDHSSDLLFAPTDVAVRNLAHEGIAGEHVVRCGDVMYDAVLHHRAMAEERSPILDTLGLEPGGFILATVHRQENTDDPGRLAGIVEGLTRAAERIPVVLPLHPRTRDRLERHGLRAAAEASLRLVDPVGYLDMLRLESVARVILTDSGGVQKEAYFVGVPCITLRDETEWTELVDVGANRLVGADPDRLAAALDAVLAADVAPPASHLYGDGRAGEAICDRLLASSPCPA